MRACETLRHSMMVTVPHCLCQGVCHVVSMVHVSPRDGHVDDEQAKHPNTGE